MLKRKQEVLCVFLVVSVLSIDGTAHSEEDTTEPNTSAPNILPRKAHAPEFSPPIRVERVSEPTGMRPNYLQVPQHHVRNTGGYGIPARPVVDTSRSQDYYVDESYGLPWQPRRPYQRGPRYPGPVSGYGPGNNGFYENYPMYLPRGEMIIQTGGGGGYGPYDTSSPTVVGGYGFGNRDTPPYPPYGRYSQLPGPYVYGYRGLSIG